MNKYLEQALGAQIRRARLVEDITQAELATAANISPVTLSKLESGQGSTVRTLVSVLSALGREEWLLTLEPEPQVSPLQLARQARGLKPARRASRRRS